MMIQELNKAIAKSADYIYKSQEIIIRVTRKLAKDKGFKNYRLFHCAYAGDMSLIVSIDKIGDVAELTLEEMFHLTKEEITNRLVNDSCLSDEKKTKIEELLQ